MVSFAINLFTFSFKFLSSIIKFDNWTIFSEYKFNFASYDSNFSFKKLFDVLNFSLIIFCIDFISFKTSSLKCNKSIFIFFEFKAKGSFSLVILFFYKLYFKI